MSNRDLRELYEADQIDRMTDDMDWGVLRARDDQRLDHVQAIVDAGEAKTADDWFHAAVVMHHGTQLAHYQLAHEWAVRASELDPERGDARLLAAAAKDRRLTREGKPQLYGTQYIRRGGRWVLQEVDPSITDEERARWNVPPLAEAQRRAEQMNAGE